MSHRRGSPGADPAVSAVVAFCLVCKPLPEILLEFLGCELAEGFLVNAQEFGHHLRVFQPFLEHGLDSEVEFCRELPAQLRTLEKVGEDPVVDIEIPLGFDHDRT